jgi:hypothetical protein
VNALEARFRIRPWAGASRKSIWRTNTLAIGTRPGRPRSESCSGVGVRVAEKSRRTVAHVAVAVTTQVCRK